jgi:hypothetical protein
MPDQEPFDLFMGQHAPLLNLVTEIDEVIWDKAALDPVIKERARIASAEALQCSY